MSNTTFPASLLAMALIGAAFGPQAHAAVAISGGSADGTLDVTYGSGGVATLEGFTAGPFGVLKGSDANAAANLSFSASTAVDSAGHLITDFSLTNTSAGTNLNLDFLALVDPDDGDFFTDDIPTAIEFPDNAPAGEPVRWEVDSFFGDINTHAGSGGSGSLDNMNQCGASCDVSFALQWSLAIGPGQTGIVSVALADDGFALSQRYLRAAVDDGSGNPVPPELTLSGNATVVPAPGALLLLASALAGVVGLGRRGRIPTLRASAG